MNIADFDYFVIFAGYRMGRRGRVASAGQVASGRGRGSGRRRGDLSVFEFPNSDIVGNTSSEYETAVEEQVPRGAETQAPASPINRMPHSQLMAERELLGMKIRMLERSVSELTARGRSLKRKRPRDSAQSGSPSSSSSRSSSSDSSRSRSRSPKRKARSAAGDVASWKTTSYAKQFELNAELLDLLHDVRSAKSKKRRRKAAKKGERLLKERQEWLVIAEKHGHQVATSFQEGDQLMALVGGAKKQKRLQAAIQAEGSKKKVAGVVRGPTMPNPIHTMQGAVMPLSHPPLAMHAPMGNFRSGVCHRCGQPGHYVKFCPQRANTAGQPGQQAMPR